MADHFLRAIAQRLLVDQRDGEGPDTRGVELQVQGPSVPLGNECRDKALECGWQLPEVVNVQCGTSCGGSWLSRSPISTIDVLHKYRIRLSICLSICARDASGSAS